MWKTFRAEFKHIFRNKWRAIAFIMLLLIPFTYGFLYMNAYWAPFSHVDQLKIAIVSRDSGTAADSFIKHMTTDGSLTAGKNQVYKVVEDESIKADPEAAVDSGKYAAVIVVPEGYSNMISAFDTKQKAHNAVERLSFLNKDFTDSLSSITDTKYHKVSFYFSYKHSYLSGEMTNFVAQNTGMVLSSLYPNLANSGLTNTIIKQLLDIAHTNTNPLISIEKNGSDVFKSYGTGLAPYFVSIALWAGALATLFIVKNERYIKTESTVKHFFGKAAVWILIGWIQATILITAITLQGVRLGWDRQWELYLFAYFMATIFPLVVMSVAYTMRYGDLGEFLVVILLVMQLISSSGTFPVEMQNIIFKIIHPIAPFTYTIDSIREIMWDTDILHLFGNMGILLIFPIIAVPLSLFINWRFDKKNVREIDGIKEYQSFEIHLGDY